MKVPVPVVLVIFAFTMFGGMFLGRRIQSQDNESVKSFAGISTTEIKPEWFKEVTVNGFAYMIYTGPGQICNLSDWQVPTEGKSAVEQQEKSPVASKVIPITPVLPSKK